MRSVINIGSNGGGKKYFLLLTILLLVFSVRANSERLTFSTIETGNALTQAWINSIEQDFIGFIWIGTTDGLYRYDGYEFKAYRSIPGTEKSLPGNNISAVFEDSQHTLWVTTSRGLARYDRNTDQFISDSLWPNINVTSATESKNGDIYFGSFEGLHRYLYSADTLITYTNYTADADTIFELQQVFVTQPGSILVSSARGLEAFDPESGKFTPLLSLGDIPSGQVLDIVEDHMGTIWISTREHGLLYIVNQLNPKIGRVNVDRNHFLNTGSVLSLLEGSDSTLWIGTENNGIVLLDLDEFYKEKTVYNQIKNTDTQSPLANNSIYSLFQDRHDNIWIGTYNGLSFYNPINSNFRHVKEGDSQSDLNNAIVNAFFEDEEFVWVATEGGVNILDKATGNFRYLTHDPNNRNSLSSNAVWAITRDSQGNMWFGTWSGGLNKYNPETGRITRFLAGDTEGTLSNNNVFSILEDKNGKIWVATMGGGLNLYNPETNIFTQYMNDPDDPATLSNNWVRQVFVDSKDRMWVSTYTSLELFNRNTGEFYHFFSSEDEPSGLSDNGAIVIFEDSRENIWFGTETGLNLFNPMDSTFTLYNTDDGLPSNVIQAIQEDKQGNLWISTNNGISKFSQGTFLPDSVEFKNFDVRDGLQGNRFNRRSSLHAKDGRIFFGGKNGFNSFHPNEILLDTIKPPVVITQFLLFNKTEVVPGMGEPHLDKPISLADHLTLKYKNSVFTIKFAALNYLFPEKNEYKYRLEGFEETWNEVGNQRSATYTNLDPGTYTFQVMASNSNNVWNTRGEQLQIKILPPWYRTSLAYFGYFLIISAIVLLFRRFVVIRTRLQQQLSIQNLEREKLGQINQMKTRFFTNISHEFRTPLTLIISPLDSMLSDISLKPSITNQLQVVQKNARRLLRLINQLLDISEIEADHLKLKVSPGDIVEYIREITSLFRWPANQRNITYSFNSEIERCICYFDGDKLEKIFYNLISNAFKYTPSNGEVTVTFKIRSDLNSAPGRFAEITVSDSGVGIKPQDQKKIFEHFYRIDDSDKFHQGGSGIGLGLVKGLIHVYHGDIRLDSEEGKGTDFTVILPIDRPMFNEREIDETKPDTAPVTLDIYDLEQGMLVSDAEPDPIHSRKDDGEKVLPLALIVEDNDELRTHLREYFSRSFRVLDAPNGKIAFDLALEHAPNILISDIRMPEMDGIELCKSMKQDPATSHIPIILLTAKATVEDRFEGVSMGADAYITKPFEIQILEATAKNLVNLREQLKEKYTRSVVIEPTEISITSVDEKFLRKAIKIVEENIANTDYSVDAFSKDIGMSRSHLHRKFVGLTGHSPSGFIRTLRMKRAAQLLTKGQLTVSEILFEVGIKSRSYFTKSFKEQFGFSPTEYVARHQSDLSNQSLHK